MPEYLPLSGASGPEPSGQSSRFGPWAQTVADAQNGARPSTERVLREVLAERARQWFKWGWSRSEGTEADRDLVAHEHDDAHVEGDWTRFVVRFLGRAEQAIEDNDPIGWREQMVKVAALAVAAVESYDRKQDRA